jgi:hypothetical protein
VIGLWKRAILASGLVWVVSPAPSSAQESPWTLLSPWTLNRSGYFFQTTTGLLSTDRVYDQNGVKTDLPPGQHYRDITTSLHLEYGIRDRIGLLMVLPVRALRLEQDPTPDLKTTGIGDFTGGVRYRILNGSLVASAQGEIKLPTGYNAVIQNPSLGQGQTDYTARFLLGKGVGRQRVFGQASGGYRYRTGRPANEILANFDLGGWAGQRALLGAHWEYAKHQGSDVPYGSFQGGVTARYRLRNAWNAVAGLFHVFGGQNAPAGTRFFVGVNLVGNQLGGSSGFLASAEPGPRTPPAVQAAPTPKEEPKPAPPPPAEETPTPPDSTGQPPNPVPPSPPKG